MQDVARRAQTSALAIWSLVLGVLSLTCFGLVTGVPGVICGHKARTRIKASNGSVTGDGLAVAGLITGYLGSVFTGIFMTGVLLSMFVPALSSARSEARNAVCMSNIRQIDLALIMYVDEHGQWPEDLSALGDFVGQAKVFVCPGSGHTAGSMEDVTTWTDYVYLPGTGRDHDPAHSAVLYCPPENHGGRSANVAFMDGHVERQDTLVFRALLAEQGTPEEVP